MVLALSSSGVLTDLENASYRWLFQMRGQRAWDDRIVAITIDEVTLSELGQYPLPRRVYTQLLESLADAQPESIGFNIFFVEPNSADAEFAEAIAQAGNVVLPVGVDDRGHILRPVKPLRSAAIATGHTLKQVDGDGLVRTVRLEAANESVFGAVLVQGAAETADQFTSIEEDLWINWPGSMASLPQYHLSDVIAGRISPHLFDGKFVLVGTTATGVDALPTPFDNNPPASGIALHAAVIDNLLQQRYLRSLSMKWLWGLMLILMPGGSYLLIGQPLRWQLVIVAGALAGWLVLSVTLFDQNYLLPRVPPLTLIGIAGLNVIVSQKLRESLALQQLLDDLWSHYRHSNAELCFDPPAEALIPDDLGTEVYRLALIAELLGWAQATQSAIAQTAPMGILTVDNQDRVGFCNSLAIKYLGIELGNPFSPAIVPHWLSHEQWQSIKATLYRGDAVSTIECQKNDSWFELRFKALEEVAQSRLLIADKRYFVLLLIEDITHRKTAEIQLRLLNEHLEDEVQQRTQALKTTNLALMKEVMERRNAQEQLTYRAFHDELTGLPNRAYLKVKLTELTIHSQSLFTILFIDCDRFKLVNDSYGHLVGDELLKAISQRLKYCIKSTDIITRFGGDEFTILLSGIKDSESAIRVSQRIRQQFLDPFVLSDHEFYSSCSIGIVLSNSNYQKAEDMLRDADIAMYCAKRSATGYALFEPHMHLAVRSSLQLETELHQSLARQELVVHYQPIFDIQSQQIRGFEALVRWQHPVDGLVSPDKFIPIAEETGLIIPIGEWVLKEACHQMRKWQQQINLPENVFISVNLSVQQFNEPRLLQRIDNTLEETQLESQYLKLEITESAIIADSDLAVQTFYRLKDRGISLGIDDFGTGYSSLNYLHRFPIDVLKVDRSFVHRMAEGQKYLSLVQAIRTLAQHFDMTMIAEGIETEEQIEYLKAMDCFLGQGYFFSPPIDCQTLEARYGNSERQVSRYVS